MPLNRTFKKGYNSEFQLMCLLPQWKRSVVLLTIVHEAAPGAGTGGP